MKIAVPFPEKLPDGYKWLSEEPIFDPLKHLSLQFPSEIFSLEDLGYKPAVSYTHLTLPTKA